MRNIVLIYTAPMMKTTVKTPFYQTEFVVSDFIVTQVIFMDYLPLNIIFALLQPGGQKSLNQ
jgi:hypothetical protein